MGGGDFSGSQATHVTSSDFSLSDGPTSKYSERGAELIGRVLHPHQKALGALFDERNETTAVCWGRRNGKTESVWSWIFGLCDLEPFTQVVVTAQTGSKARERMMSQARRLERFYPEDAGGPQIKRGAVASIEFKNGSRIWVATPDEDAFRGDEAHVIFIDEAQSFDPAESYALRQGAAPLLDTVQDGVIIMAGTPGRQRAGWYWDSLQAGQQGVPGVAASVYAATEADDINDEEVWKRVLPGVGTLTTIEKMRARREQLSDVEWAQEYLGIWPISAGDRAISAEAWEATSESVVKPDTERFTVALSVATDSSSAALVAAWRDSEGVGHVSVLDHRTGTNWLPDAAYGVLNRNPKARLVYDEIGANREPTEVLLRQRGIKSRVQPSPRKEVQAGQASLVRQVHAGTVKHAEQPSLNKAAEVLQWREVRENGRWFGWARSDGDITPIAAAALALWDVDQNKNRKVLIIPNA